MCKKKLINKCNVAKSNLIKIKFSLSVFFLFLFFFQLKDLLSRIFPHIYNRPFLADQFHNMSRYADRS